MSICHISTKCLSRATPQLVQHCSTRTTSSAPANTSNAAVTRAGLIGGPPDLSSTGEDFESLKSSLVSKESYAGHHFRQPVLAPCRIRWG